MISYFPEINEPVPGGRLYRYCRDEGLNYPYVAAGLKAKRRTAVRKIWKWILRRALLSKRFEIPDRAPKEDGL